MKKTLEKFLPAVSALTLIVCGSTLTASAKEVSYVNSNYSAAAANQSVIKGDVNGDGKLSTADVGLANAYVRGTKQLNSAQKYEADLNWDGKISTADVGKINAMVRGTLSVAAPSAPVIEDYFSSDAESITFYWTVSDTANGYYVYRKNNGKWVKIADISNRYDTMYTDRSLASNTAYEYSVQAYTNNGPQKKVSAMSTGKKMSTLIKGIEFTYVPSPSMYIDRLNSATTTKADKTYKLYNRQGKKTTTSTYTLSDADMKTLKKFADKHFTSSMTKGQKVDYTLKWINRNVTYAKSSAAYNKIAGKSFVDAVFNYKSGQCIQYNGALVAMMNYLGYDANLVQGYRGTENGSQWQHFWGEVKIGKNVYLMETGNYGEDGDWNYCCVTYKESNPWGGASYIMNGKAADK